MDERIRQFGPAAIESFGYLVDEYSFHGPDDSDEGFVEYARPPWWVSIGVDVHNRTVDTYIRYDDGARQFHIPLSYFLVEAKLGSAQEAGGSAQTRQGMMAGITRQAQALRKAAPLLGTDAGLRILERADAD